MATSVVPAWTMLRKSLSSEAAASLITALTCAASATAEEILAPHRTTARPPAVPPCSRARSRMMTEEDSIPAPQRGAGERAGDQHRRMIDRLRRRVGRADPCQNRPIPRRPSSYEFIQIATYQEYSRRDKSRSPPFRGSGYRLFEEIHCG